MKIQFSITTIFDEWLGSIYFPTLIGGVFFPVVRHDDKFPLKKLPEQLIHVSSS